MSVPMFDLSGKVAIVTGGNGGIGLGIAKGLAGAGGDIVVAARSASKTEEAVDQLQGLGVRAIGIATDVANEGSVGSMVDAAIAEFGRIDVLVNNAGILRMGGIADISVENYMQVIEVNQLGPLLGMQAVLPAMIEAGSGSIVNISSVAGLSGVPGMAAYVSSKFALRGMTKTAAIEFGQYGIRVNSVHPGGVDTPMIAPLGGDGEQNAETDGYSGVLLGRVGTAEEMAQLVAFLASDESSYCTGSEFTADGGMLCRVPM
jgi:3alpha(or 20beta)-hydroxysteroid dehydrogenase